MRIYIRVSLSISLSCVSGLGCLSCAEAYFEYYVCRPWQVLATRRLCWAALTCARGNMLWCRPHNLVYSLTCDGTCAHAAHIQQAMITLVARACVTTRESECPCTYIAFFGSCIQKVKWSHGSGSSCLTLTKKISMYCLWPQTVEPPTSGRKLKVCPPLVKRLKHNVCLYPLQGCPKY